MGIIKTIKNLTILNSRSMIIKKMDKELKNIIKTALILSCIMAFFGLALKNIIIYIGLMLGSVISILNFLLLQNDVKKVVRSGKKAVGYAVSGYFKRYFIMIALIGGFGYFFGEAVIAVVPGLFIIKVSIYLNQGIAYIKTLIKERR